VNVSLLRYSLVLTVLAVIIWLLMHQAATPPASLADQPWGPGKNAFDCAKDAPVNPLPPELDAVQRARVLALLREACHPQ
jgi:hypothetical protein